MSISKKINLEAGADATTEEQDIAISLFNSSFGFSIANIDEQKLYVDNKYSYDDFRDIWVKADLKKYAALMYIYCQIFRKKYDNSEMTEEISENESNIDYEIKLLKLLIPFFTTETPQINIKGGGLITDNNIIKEIGLLLSNKYESEGFCSKPLTIGQAKQEIIDKTDQVWMEGYKLRRDLSTWVQYDDLDFDLTMIEWYAKEHFQKIELSKEHLLSRLNELEMSKKSKKEKAESLEKNANIWRFGEKVSYIIAFDKFRSQKKCSSIEEFKITDKDRKTIHDCLAFFDLIEDKSQIKIQNSTATTTPQKYVYQRLDYYRKNIKDKFENENERITEKEINLFRSYLNNEITRYEKYSSLSNNIYFLDYDTFEIE